MLNDITCGPRFHGACSSFVANSTLIATPDALHCKRMNASNAATVSGRSPARSRKLTVLPMIAVTYFMVAGGPYGLEDIVQKTGYRVTLLILIITPLLWSLPTAL